MNVENFFFIFQIVCYFRSNGVRLQSLLSETEFMKQVHDFSNCVLFRFQAYARIVSTFKYNQQSGVMRRCSQP